MYAFEPDDKETYQMTHENAPDDYHYDTHSNVKLGVHLRQNSLESGLETALTNVYGSESTLGDKLELVAESACVTSGQAYFCTRDLVSSLLSMPEELRPVSIWCFGKTAYLLAKMSTRHWTDQEILELISLYEEKEFLWNVNHKLYRNREKKMSLYEEFATKFNNCDPNEIQRKIHNLRNQVSHEIKKIKKMKSGDGADDKYESKWKFFSALQFIVPSFTPTKTTSNMNDTLENSETEQIEQTLNAPPILENKKKRSNKRPSQNEDDETVLKEALEIMKKPKNDFHRFGEYVALELKTLKSDYYRGLLKREIRRAIANISDMDERNHWSSVMPSPSSASTCSTPMPSPTGFENNFSPSGESQTAQNFYNSYNEFI